MGLDNGIVLKIIEREAFGPIPEWFRHDSWQPADEYDINYWRKCWNVRSAIADVIGGIYDNGETPLMYEDIIAVIKRLKQFNEKNWLGDSWDEGSIWEWDEIKGNHRGCIKRLKKLARLMKRHPEIEVYFYDSY